MANKPSTRLHEVYNRSFKYIVFAGSQGACNAYWNKQSGYVRQDLEVRVAKR